MKLLLENWRKYLNENKEKMLKMSLHDFDQTKNGWRKFKDPKQRAAVCNSQFEQRKKSKGTASWDDVRQGDVLGLI